MARNDRKLYANKTVYGGRPQILYLWSPETDIKKSGSSGKTGKIGPSCTATKGSQGYDNVVGYVYNLVVVNGIQQDLAYVECNYVQ